MSKHVSTHMSVHVPARMPACMPRTRRGTNVVMAHVVMAHVVMAYVVMAYVVMAHVVMADIVMADENPEEDTRSTGCSRPTLEAFARLAECGACADMRDGMPKEHVRGHV